MQYEQLAGGERVDLPRPSIDTGMGLERIAAVMQGVPDNFDTDTFKALIGASVELTGVQAEGGQRASHRVIADHLRASSFLIADGVLPSNEGAWLCAPPHHAPCDAPCASAGSQGPADAPRAAVAGGGNGRGLP